MLKIENFKSGQVFEIKKYKRLQSSRRTKTEGERFETENQQLKVN